MRQTTLFLARYLGVFAVIECGWLLLDRDAGVAMVRGILRSPELAFTYGMISLAVGLAMVIGHNLWRGGALTVVVTLLGWLILLRGIAMQAIGADAAQRLFETLQSQPLYDGYLLAVLALGLWLAVAGFWPRRSDKAS
jgi:hypothetical protein